MESGPYFISHLPREERDEQVLEAQELRVIHLRQIPKGRNIGMPLAGINSIDKHPRSLCGIPLSNVVNDPEWDWNVGDTKGAKTEDYCTACTDLIARNRFW